MFGDIIQPTHLLFILVVALLVLGPKRLPEVGRSLGKGLRDFRTAMSGIEEHTTGLFKEEPTMATHTSVPTPAADATSATTSAHVTEEVAVKTATATVAADPEPSDYAD